jgi:hypothetical protein
VALARVMHLEGTTLMCQRIDCPKCGKPSYAGCGRHIEAVLADVPLAERCRCREEKRARASTSAVGKSSWFASLFTRGRRQP